MPLSSRAGRMLATLAVVAICTFAAALVWNEVRRAAFQTGPPPITRGPQVGSVTQTSLTVMWNTDHALKGAIEFGEGEASGRRAEDTSEAETHSLSITGLKPGTKYVYRVLSAGKPTGPDHTFTTAPEGAPPFRFVAIGDSGSGSDEQIHIAGQILGEKPDFLIHTGDVVYPHGNPRDFDEDYFHPYRALIDHIPFYLSLGNHDIEFDRGLTLLNSAPLPKNDRTNTSEFYSWDWSNGHFVALDNEINFGKGSPQYEWLEADLARNKATWTVVFFHHPPYTSSRSVADAGVITQWCPLFEQNHVDLALSGHDHNYERSYPMVMAQPVGKEGNPDYVDPPGPIYVVTGGGGKSLYENGKKAFTVFSMSAYHYTRVDVSGLTLTLTAIGADDKPFDRMSIRKTR